jgi:hypothetical protein
MRGASVDAQLAITDAWLRLAPPKDIYNWLELGYFLPGALLFVTIAASRNARLPPPVDEDTGREWSAADKDEFRRLLDQQRR